MPASAVGRRLRAPMFVLVLLALLSATLGLTAQSANAARAQHTPPVVVRLQHAASIAISKIGDPYRYGAEGPSAFDCSGLTMYAYSHAGLSLPRTAAEQYASVRHIAKDNLQRGDLLFFHDSSGHVFHVAMFLQWDRLHRPIFVHAPYPGTHVHREVPWTSAWYAGTRRPIP